MDRIVWFALLVPIAGAVSPSAASYSPDCRDKEMVCHVLVQSMPNFCHMIDHAKYAAENCQKTCGFCKVRPTSFEHGTNLIWAQTPYVKVYSVSRLVAIPDDPGTWVANRKPQVTYISAPHFTWEFKALAFHWEDQTLYWSESMNKKIQSLVLNGSTDTMTLFAGTSPEVYGIAVDWLSRNLYFTDSLYNWIMMTSSTPGQPAYKIVVQDRLDSPHGVAVYPQKGYLIWSDWGARPRIEIADLLGQNRRTLVERDIMKPRGLTIDYSKNALYWVDTIKATVEVVLFNGQGRRVIHKEEGTSFYGVALFKNFIFVTERSRGMLKVFEKRQSVVSFTLGNVPSDIVMYDGSQQLGNSTDCQDLGCEHFCVLDPLTGPNCYCGEGYIGEDAENKSCKPSMKFVHPSHIYAIRDSICQYPANLADMSLSNVTLDSQCFLEDGQGYMTLTFDARENMLYYFGNNTKTISRIPLEMGGKGAVLTGGTGIVRGMALDWVAGNLYWTDSTNGVIKVARKTGSYQTVILEKLNNPFGIVVHPGRGKIYWTDHGHLPDVGGKVEMANLDGTERDLIMGDNVGQPNHLFIDFQKDCLYWADSILHHVRKYDFETERITVIYEQANVKFYGLSLFKDFILWTDTEDLNGIHIARMDKKEKVRGIIHPRNGLAADLITFDISNQPKQYSPCADGNSKCSQLCLATASNASQCYCGLGYELALDGFTCISTPVMDNFLLVNDAYQKQIFQVNLKNGVAGVVDLQPSHEPIALAYDPFDFKVFWSDNKQNLIKEASIDGQFEKEVLLLNNSSMCDGLVVDYINRLLFFTDTGNNVIGVVSLRNYDLVTYIHKTNLDQPRDIVVSPNQGIIYWSDWGSSARIEKSYMDGSGREALVSFTSAAWPNGLALDLKENKLYWVDAQMDTISVIDLATKKITKLVDEPGAHYFSVDVIGEYLYVADWKKNYLRRMNKRGGPLLQYGKAKFTRLYGIKGYNSTESFRGISVCVNSVCEHLCLPKENNQFTCRCAEGYIEQGLHCLKQNVTNSPTLPPFTNKPATYTLPPSATTTSKTTTTSPTMNTTTYQTSVPTVQSTHSPAIQTTSTITKLPVTMSTSRESQNSSTGPSTEINTTSKPVVDYSISPGGGETGQSSSGKASSGLSSAVIALIVVSIIIVIAVVIIAAVLFKRKYSYRINHAKLVEDTPPVDFYKIAYPARGEDVVTFGTGTGIENPTYDCLHDPSNNVMTNSNREST